MEENKGKAGERQSQGARWRHGCVSQCEKLSNVAGIKNILTLSLLI